MDPAEKLKHELERMMHIADQTMELLEKAEHRRQVRLYRIAIAIIGYIILKLLSVSDVVIISDILVVLIFCFLFSGVKALFGGPDKKRRRK